MEQRIHHTLTLGRNIGLGVTLLAVVVVLLIPFFSSRPYSEAMPWPFVLMTIGIGLGVAAIIYFSFSPRPSCVGSLLMRL